ncbi:MAG TPA: sigma-70 family RNA polymerase sigma factor [Urbifossiella sp.]|jgi:RNA polymerase sigma factor (sigma-70 family)|nr:sigma-70 family RNA polymerase sigma factor [Urbifossiella sp.]
MPAPVLKLLASAAPAAEPDADLLARFIAARDDVAFAELVRRHGPAVYHTCRRLVGPAAADDAFQATFLVLAARAGSVRKAASVGSWLIGVAGRVGRRMRVRGPKAEDRRRASTDPDQLPVPGSPPDAALLSSDLGEALADEFTRLPDRLRAAAVACLVDGRTQEQASAVLGWSSRTVRRRVDEAKGLLRARLERRGITPAVAAAAVAAGEAAAVPVGLARRATDAATLFLAGGGAGTPAAALAHGVIGTMTTIRSTAAAAACAAVLAGLGIGWAGDTPAPAPPVPEKRTTAAQDDPARIPPPSGSRSRPPAEPRPAPPAAKPDPVRITTPPASREKPVPPPSVARHTHKTANFVVEAPTAAVARAVGDEFELQRATAAKTWFGKDLPAWSEPVGVRVEPHPSGDFYSGVVRFKAVPGAESTSGISGRLDALLAREIPLRATQMVVTTVHEWRLPWWAEAALAGLFEPDQDQLRAVRDARRLVEDGRAFHLAALFRKTAAPPGEEGRAQAVAVARFLMTREPDLRFAVFEGGSIGVLDRPPALGPEQSAAKSGLFTFLLIGRGGTGGPRRACTGSPHSTRWSGRGSTGSGTRPPTRGPNPPRWLIRIASRRRCSPRPPPAPTLNGRRPSPTPRTSWSLPPPRRPPGPCRRRPNGCGGSWPNSGSGRNSRTRMNRCPWR